MLYLTGTVIKRALGVKLLFLVCFYADPGNEMNVDAERTFILWKTLALRSMIYICCLSHFFCFRVKSTVFGQRPTPICS